MDEDELAREQERKARAALFSSLGPNVGSNADWADPAYQLDGKRFLVDSEDGTLDIVKRGRWNKRDEFYEDETLARFDTAAEAAAWLKTQRLRSNPRRKLPKSGEGKGIVSRAERGLGTKYRTMREGMLLEGGDVMLLPHRLPGHEGKRMTDLSEAGREWDYEYNDAKPILDLLAASKAPMLRRTTVAKKLKEEGMSVDEVFRGFAFLRSHGLLKEPREGYVALAKANPRREVETEEYFAAMEPTRAKYASRSPEELVLVRSRAAKMLRKFDFESEREVAKALGLDPRDPKVLKAIELMRKHPVLDNPRRRGPDARLATLVASGVRRGKKEILEDIQKGRVPRTVKTFSELHDYVDANEYGGLFSDTFQSLPQDTRIAVMEEVQGALDAWLRSRGGNKATPRSKANPRPAARAKRTESRTAAQSNAAKAMRLFHSGQASSLAEAWAMLRR